MKELIKKGADLNARIKEGSAPLHMAAVTGRRALSRLLIKHGAQIDMKDDEGRTALHLATAQTHMKFEVDWFFHPLGSTTTARH